jgi:hypothetical protein
VNSQSRKYNLANMSNKRRKKKRRRELFAQNMKLLW